MDTLIKDFRYAFRTLSSSPGFSLAAILTLGLGIGATTMVFSLINGTALRPFPYERPGELVQVTEVDATGEYDGTSYPNFVDYRDGMKSLSGLAAFTPRNITVRGQEPERVEGAAISHNMFEVLGMRPLHGRTFRADEDRPGGAPAVLLSHSLWQRSFGGDPQIVGEAVNVEGTPHTVVGIMPPDFRFPERADAWVPLRQDPAANRGHRHLTAIGRLRPGATVAQAHAEARAIGNRLREQYERGAAQKWYGRAAGLQQITVRETKQIGVIMLGAVAFVLLIACANVANLMLARAAARDKEIAIRAALGAGRARIVRQLLTESSLLALAGGALGVLLASWWLDLILGTIPMALPFWMKVEIDSVALLFALVVSLGTAIMFGLVPALQAARGDVQSTLKEGRAVAGSRQRSLLRSALAVGQLALAVILLSGGLLMARSFLKMRNVDPGFRIENIAALEIDLPGPRYEGADARIAAYDQLLQRVRAIAGVQRAGAVLNLPIGGGNWTSNFSIDGRGERIEESAQNLVVTPGYFETLDITLLRGRYFGEQDKAGAEKVAIINQRLADRYFANQDPIGRRIAFGAGDGLQWLTIVGVVRDINQSTINQKRIEPDIYRPYAQAPERSMTLVVRSAGGLASLLPLLRREVQAIDPNIPLFNATTMGQVIEQATWDAKLSSSLFSAFALAAILLAAVGLYGVVAYSVAQRKQEIGVRVALGARPSAVLGLIVGQGTRLTVLGTALGLAGALAMGRALSSVLFGVKPNDPFTFLVVPVVLALVALLASYIPARRALRIDPMTALRLE